MSKRARGQKPTVGDSRLSQYTKNTDDGVRETSKTVFNGASGTRESNTTPAPTDTSTSQENLTDPYIRPPSLDDDSLGCAVSSSREMLLLPGHLKGYANSWSVYQPERPEEADEENLGRKKTIQFFYNNDVSAPSSQKKLLDQTEPSKGKGKALRSPVEAVKEGLTRLKLRPSDQEFTVRWTIPFNKAKSEEGVKISGLKGTFRFTSEQCSTPKGKEEIRSCLRANLPLARAKSDMAAVELTVKFRLTQPFNNKEIPVDARTCYEILLGAGPRFMGSTKVELAYNHMLSIDEVVTEIKRTTDRLLVEARKVDERGKTMKAGSWMEADFAEAFWSR